MILLGISLVVTGYFFLSVLEEINLLKKRLPAKSIPDNKLPSISVLIPARNETEDLIGCLDSLVDSNYLKIETIVLDDCSDEPRTPEIIRSYAQKGIRFVSGDVAPDKWTAKNYALDQLSENANGEYLVFMGVDVRLGINAIKNVIERMVEEKLSMVSVIPLNKPTRFTLMHYLIQPMRYFVELIIPSKFFHTSGALSTFWIISSKDFKKLGGFKSVTHTVQPEKYFARELDKKDKYLFYAANQDLDIRSLKSINDQKETSLRLLYPAFRKRPENVSVLTLLLLISIFIPLYSLFYGLSNQNYIILFIGVICLVLHSLSINAAFYLTYRKSNLLSFIVFPIALIYLVYEVYKSMYLYDFSVVSWKGRNVCIPVMHKYTNDTFLNSEQSK